MVVADHGSWLLAAWAGERSGGLLSLGWGCTCLALLKSTLLQDLLDYILVDVRAKLILQGAFPSGVEWTLGAVAKSKSAI